MKRLILQFLYSWFEPYKKVSSFEHTLNDMMYGRIPPQQENWFEDDLEDFIRNFTDTFNRVTIDA